VIVNWTYIETIDPPGIPELKLHEICCDCCEQLALAVVVTPAGKLTDVPLGIVAARTVWVAVAFAKMFLNLRTSSPVLFADRTLGTTETNKQFACFGATADTCVQALLPAALPPDAKARNAAAVPAAARPRMPRPRLNR
jgi:hypothetical protein